MTCMRYLINRLLSLPPSSSSSFLGDSFVAVLDLDSGQNEFAPPGCISQTILRRRGRGRDPVLG